MSVPAFIDLTEANQTIELREYLKSVGAEIKGENRESLKQDIEEIIKASETLWKNGEDKDIEGVINSVLSLLFVIPADECESLITLLCDQLLQGGKDGRSSLSMKLFHNLFHGFDIKHSFLYETFCAWVKVASSSNCIEDINADLPQVIKYLDIWESLPENRRKLLRLLHGAQLACGNSEQASKTMSVLLGGYDDDNTDEAKEDARLCVKRALSDEKKYLYDHLLTLKPVQALKGEPIYQLLQIFIHGSLEEFEKFHSTNAELFEKNELPVDDCRMKMQLLSFIDLVGSVKEMSFQDIQNSLSIQEDKIEEFVIDAFQSKMVAGKIDHMNRKISISHTVQRTFKDEHWKFLEDRLKMWRENLTSVNGRLQTIQPMA